MCFGEQNKSAAISDTATKNTGQV